jgi:D-alanyl-D-alanine carboxypeptidase (penicillin-binding protein 5/6)
MKDNQHASQATAFVAKGSLKLRRDVFLLALIFFWGVLICATQVAKAETKTSNNTLPASPPATPTQTQTTSALVSQPLPQAPEVIAKAYLLMDVNAHQILAEQAADEPIEPASLTKLMSAYLVFDALRLKKINLTQTLPVSIRAWRVEGSRMFIDPKMQVPIEDLIKGMIVQSGNDATLALAEGVGGTEQRFVEMMNQQAALLGMKHTVFKNAEGLPEKGHLTTARDLSILATRLMQDFPQYVGYYAIKKYRYPGTPISNENNRNTLLVRDPSVDGLKTGHTEAAGFCIIATAKRDTPNFAGRRLLAIVLGASSDTARANEAEKLLNWGFTAFEDVKLYDSMQAVQVAPIWKGHGATIKIGRSDSIVVSIPSGQAGSIKSEVLREDPLFAPVQMGQPIGKLKVKLSGATLLELPLQSLETVEQAGLLGRAWDSLRLWIK